jgi:hypothetical protein
MIIVLTSCAVVLGTTVLGAVVLAIASGSMRVLGTTTLVFVCFSPLLREDFVSLYSFSLLLSAPPPPLFSPLAIKFFLTKKYNSLAKDIFHETVKLALIKRWMDNNQRSINHSQRSY